MQTTRRFTALVLLAFWSVLLRPAAASPEQVVFLYDKSWRPVVRLDRLPSGSGVRAILALYALQNGAGCQGKEPDDLVDCALTRALGLGANCSSEHLSLVRSWFTTTPKLSPRWRSRDAPTQEPGTLEGLCYRQPDTASWQNIWELIRLRPEGNLVHVNAVLFWGSQYGRGRVLYEHTFRVDGHRIITVTAKVSELSRSDKGIFD